MSTFITDRDFPLRLIAGLRHSLDHRSLPALDKHRQPGLHAPRAAQSRGTRLVGGRSSDPDVPPGPSYRIPHLYSQPGNTAMCAVTDDCERPDSERKQIRFVFHRVFDERGNRFCGLFAVMLGKCQLCISSNPFGSGANVLINVGYDPTLPTAGQPAEANFDTLTSTIGEAAKWTIEKSGTVPPLFKAGGDHERFHSSTSVIGPANADPEQFSEDAACLVSAINETEDVRKIQAALLAAVKK